MILNSHSLLRTLSRQLHHWHQPATITCKYLQHLQMNPVVSVCTLRRSSRIATRALVANSFSFSSERRIKVKVQHDAVEKIFFIEIPELKSRAYLEYEREGDIIKLTNTQVPEELADRGLGKILAKEALEFVAKNNLRMEVHCDFVRYFINKYEPKYIKYLHM